MAFWSEVERVCGVGAVEADDAVDVEAVIINERDKLQGAPPIVPSRAWPRPPPGHLSG